MYVIKLETNEYGARQPLFTWDKPTAPIGFALCPDEFYDVFYSTTPAGFVDITVEGDVVVAMGVNQVALDAYLASLPEEEPEQETEAEPTSEELINAMLGVFDE